MRKTSRVKNGIASFFKYFFMIFLIFISLAPIIWAFLGSFKSYAEINSSALSLPSSFNLDNYKAALQYAPILKYFMNSVLIVGISVLVTVALVAMCAYVISRFDFKLKTLIVLLISASLMLPAQAISQPLFAIFQKLGIFDTKLGLIIVYSAMGIPMSFFVMVSYYKTISTALEESAYIDGATFTQTFLHIILPLAKPGLVTIAMIQFINIWNEYFISLIFGNSDRVRPVAVGLYSMINSMKYTGDWAGMFAAVVIVFLPTFILYIFLSEKIIAGVTGGGVKG